MCRQPENVGMLKHFFPHSIFLALVLFPTFNYGSDIATFANLLASPLMENALLLEEK